VGACQSDIIAARERNAEIERRIMQLTDVSIQQSNGYIQQVATKLADPNQAESVSTLERLVIIGANVNTVSNLTIKTLFYRIASDPTAEVELVAFLDRSIENSLQDVKRLANAPFAALPVEAARAGEAGKGFAVVAEEVRNLAMRSAEAAKNTAGLIQRSQDSSTRGVEVSGQAVQAMDEILASAQKVAELISEISAASREQAQGIDQVNTAVAQMDKVSQQNAANAEESASASEGLSAQAASLNELVADLVALAEGSQGCETAGAGRNLPRSD